ncbi:hypothetical protein [Pseudonocardia oceani]|uniref:hypothetical protein n=1 Tax=Pseudonocardia oceani TaxID=2792013 RepID=UPI0035569C95
MAEVERTWFRRVIAADDVPFACSPEGDFPGRLGGRGRGHADRLREGIDGVVGA